MVFCSQLSSQRVPVSRDVKVILVFNKNYIKNIKYAFFQVSQSGRTLKGRGFMVRIACMCVCVCIMNISLDVLHTLCIYVLYLVKYMYIHNLQT